MAGERWQARVVTSEEPADGLWLGEIVFNSDRNSIGVMGDVFTSWFPNIDVTTTDFTMLPEWVMTGYAGSVKSVEFKWESTALHVRPMYHPEYDEYNRGPSGTFRSDYVPHAPSISFGTTNQTYKSGPDEMVNKGAPNSLEHFAIDPSFYNKTYTIDPSVSTSLPQPNANGMLWLDNPTSEFYVVIKPSTRINQVKGAKNQGTLANTWNSQGRNVINLTVPANKAFTGNAGRGIGYRSWAHTPNIERKRLTFSMIIYGREGLRFSTRIGQPDNYQIFTSQIPASGYLHAVFPYRPERLKPEHYGKPLVIDWFYNWHYAEGKFVPNVEQYADISSLQVFEDHYLNYRLNPAYLPQDQDRHLASYFVKRNLPELATSARHSVLFPKPLLIDNYELVIYGATLPFTITEKNRHGFNIEFAVESGITYPIEFSYSARVAGTKIR